MKKLVILLPLLSSLLFCQDAIVGVTQCTIHFNNGVILEDIPTASTESTRIKGLSNRNDAGSGMLFLFTKSEFLAFWMKDTYIPLSIGFFDKKGVLFQIDDMKPHSLELHKSRKVSKMALELKKDGFRELKIKTGNKIVKLDCK